MTWKLHRVWLSFAVPVVLRVRFPVLAKTVRLIREDSQGMRSSPITRIQVLKRYPSWEVLTNKQQDSPFEMSSPCFRGIPPCLSLPYVSSFWLTTNHWCHLISSSVRLSVGSSSTFISLICMTYFHLSISLAQCSLSLGATFSHFGDWTMAFDVVRLSLVV
jgi:hypothetical protein